MRKNTIFLVIAILIIAGAIIFFITQKKDQTFAQVADAPEDAYYVFYYLVHTDDFGRTIEIDLTDDERKKLSELIKNTTVSSKPVKKFPSLITLLVDQRVRDTQGNEFDYCIYYDEDGNDYVFFENFNEYYKINDTSIGDFYREVLEKRLMVK